MYFGGFLLRRPGSWPMWLAFRTATTAVSAIVAAFILRSTALPSLEQQIRELGVAVPQVTTWVLGLGGWLAVLPVPGLALAVAAIAIRSARPTLAVAAAVATFAAVLAIGGSLVASLLPMYQLYNNSPGG